MTDWIELHLGTVEAMREDVNHWRHVAYELAGQDRAKVQAASDAVCDKFIAAGRERIGPRLPRRDTVRQEHSNDR